DETGGMQLIVHSPLGARVNRALGLGLRKKFCVTFDFELQAAASNDAVLLSLGPQHSFPLEDVPAFLRSDNVAEPVSQAGLRSLVRRFEQRTVRLHFVDTVEPSVLAHEILNGAPFTYLDEDTEIGERRSRAVPLRRGLPVEPRELGRLDARAIERVRAEATPEVRDPDELHDVLLSLIATRPRREWAGHFDALAGAGRAFEVHRDDVLWAATERRAEIEALF